MNKSIRPYLLGGECYDADGNIMFANQGEKCEKCGNILGKNSGTINQFIKRFIKKCEWCNKDYDGVKVSKFCSNACRQRNKRATKLKKLNL